MKYNQISEIQALRGISIILVFLFHLNQEIFSYGYLGVDIFFVISGFIITKIIYQNLIEKKFSIKVFFISRFLRLMPSLFFMVISISSKVAWSERNILKEKLFITIINNIV